MWRGARQARARDLQYRDIAESSTAQGYRRFFLIVSSVASFDATLLVQLQNDATLLVQLHQRLLKKRSPATQFYIWEWIPRLVSRLGRSLG